MSAGQDNEAGTPGTAGGERTSIGRRLAAAREARELTAERIAAELHLEPRVIAALERDDRDALPEPAYVKGYLRGYARLVGLPDDELVKEYTALVGEPPPLTVVRVQQKVPFFQLPSGRILRKVILLLLAAILLWLSYPLVEPLLNRQEQPGDEPEPGRLELPSTGSVTIPGLGTHPE